METVGQFPGLSSQSCSPKLRDIPDKALVDVIRSNFSTARDSQLHREPELEAGELRDDLGPEIQAFLAAEMLWVSAIADNDRSDRGMPREEETRLVVLCKVEIFNSGRGTMKLTTRNLQRI
jgi:hypothetical protein